MLDTQSVQCPYCWQAIDIVLDPSAGDQQYIEDCFVCCRPIVLRISISDEGEPIAVALHEDDC